MEVYIQIGLKLITGMIGILAFLRIAGKAQMAQITPLDTVSAFVIGALVGGVLYNPDMSMWHILFALAVWTAFNLFVRFCMRSARLRHFIKGESEYLVKNGIINFKAFKRNSLEMEQFRMLLRQEGIFSMFDVEDVLFETNGAVTEHNLKRTHRSKSWVLHQLKRNGYDNPSDLFCMEWTPRKGFYFVTYEGDVKRDKEEILAEHIKHEDHS